MTAALYHLPLPLAACLCALFCALGHVVRDGWPPTGSTQLARVLGGLACAVGVFALGWADWWHPALYSAAILGGFWLDHDHAAGQQCNAPIDILYLLISGLTSVSAIGVVGYFMTAVPLAVPIACAVAGVSKPFIWYGSYRAFPPGKSWVAPTRFAAGLFGALVGGVAVFARLQGY